MKNVIIFKSNKNEIDNNYQLMNAIHLFEGRINMDFLGTIAHWFSSGGIVMYALLLCSIISVAIIIERAKYFKARSVDNRKFTEVLEDNMNAHSIHELYIKYRGENTTAAVVASAAFRAVVRGRNPEHAMESAAQLEAAKLKKGLAVLATVVTLSPILGLLGTVVGMIQSFSVFNLQEGAPMAITGGVGEALVATASGLAVAIIALVGHSYYGYRLDNMMTSIEQLGDVIMDKLSARNTMEMRGTEKCA